MNKRMITALIVVGMSVAALAGCGSKSASPTGSQGGGGTQPTTVTPVTASSGGGNGY